MIQVTDYNTSVQPTWCPGCGNFGIWASLKQSLVDQKLAPSDIVLTYDIGCCGNGADKINSYAFKSLHGRTVPVAIGIKMANPDLPVVAIGGDGGILEEGISHLLWAARSNYNITVILHDNQVFGLTTGQPTVTTETGQPSKTAPYGVVEARLNPLHTALIANATFVARGYAGEPKHLTQLITNAMKHPGFSFVDVLQPCVTYNKHNTFQWFGERIYKIQESKNYDVTDWKQAFEVSTDYEDKIAIGVLYQNKSAPSYKDSLPHRKNASKTPVQEVRKYSISKFIHEFE